MYATTGNPNQIQRVILTFDNTRIPTLLIREKAFLRSKGIFPVRVFEDLIIKPLIPERKILNPVTEETVEASRTEEITRETITTQHFATASATEKILPCLDNSIEENLLDSFVTLTREEQTSITQRLETLKEKLLKLDNRQQHSDPPANKQLGNYKEGSLKSQPEEFFSASLIPVEDQEEEMSN
ncbi:UNVERIFIED_CONTAM: hypothetical protein K2H54_057909 [Gekko kuhli]